MLFSTPDLARRGSFFLLALLFPVLASANAFFSGDVSSDYGIAYVSADGYEEASTWIAVDGITSEYAGPVTPPPLALVVRLSRSEDPRDHGYDVAYWPLGTMYAGEQRHDLVTEIYSDDIPAGEYWVHTLLLEDDYGQRVVDARTAPRPQRWRGGIDVSGTLYVDYSDPYSLYLEIPQIRNNLLWDDSYPLEIRFYTTFEPGPAADDVTLCAFSVHGLWAGESYSQIGFRCDLNAPLYEDERIHVEVREQGAPDGDAISEAWPVYSEPDVYVYAGSLSGPTLIWLGILAGLGYRRRGSVQRHTDACHH